MKLLPPSLQAFLVVARSGTVHAAARELALTQTAITRRILTLEEELGVTLFLRSRRGMSLTESGQELFVYCQHTLDLEGETLARMTGASSGAPTKLTIQGHSSILRSRLIPAISTALAPFPQVAMEFRMNDVQTGVAALKRGDADLVVLRSVLFHVVLYRFSHSRSDRIFTVVYYRRDEAATARQCRGGLRFLRSLSGYGLAVAVTVFGAGAAHESLLLGSTSTLMVQDVTDSVVSVPCRLNPP